MSKPVRSVRDGHDGRREHVIVPMQLCCRRHGHRLQLLGRHGDGGWDGAYGDVLYGEHVQRPAAERAKVPGVLRR